MNFLTKNSLRMPNWTAILLVTAALVGEAQYMNAFIMSFFMMILHFQEDLSAALPKWILWFNQVLFVTLSVFFVFVDQTKKILEFIF